MTNIIITILLVLLFFPISAQDDITHPELTYFSIDPNEVNVTLGTFDDLSGLNYCNAGFSSPTNTHQSYASSCQMGSMI